MRVGLSLDCASADIREVLQSAVAAERAGVETIYVVESHFDPDPGCANAFAVAAALSGCLQRAWIAVQPVIGLEHPLRIVEQSNMLDVLMRGRCVIVLSDPSDAREYEAFGVPVPRNGLLEDFLQHMEHAWAWQFEEEGPPLEFHTGAFSAQMAGRIMPSAYRSSRPLVAREACTAEEVRDAARHGWALQLPHSHQVEDLVALYLQELSSNGLPPSTVQVLRERTTIRVDASLQPVDMQQLAMCGVAEVRVNPASLEQVLKAVSNL